MEKKKIGVTDLLLCVASLAFLAGQLFLFHACDSHEDGSWMNCHWADMILRGLATVLLVLAAGHAGASHPWTKLGIALGMIPVAGLAALVPGVLIDLCMMDSMRCRSLMRPAALAFSLLIVGLAVADVFVQRRQAREV